MKALQAEQGQNSLGLKQSKKTSRRKAAAGPTSDDQTVMHRIAVVRRQQRMSLRSVARHTGTDVESLRQQERETADLRLSDLYKWQQAMDVPTSELLVEPDTGLSRPVMERARLVRVMKTAMAIRERAEVVGTRRMAQMLVEQLVELMPELEDVSAWKTVGQRRTSDELGRIAERRIPDDLFSNSSYD